MTNAERLSLWLLLDTARFDDSTYLPVELLADTDYELGYYPTEVSQ